MHQIFFACNFVMQWFTKSWLAKGVTEMCIKLNVSVVVPEYQSVFVPGMLPLNQSPGF